jgi:predicted N-formylglutamate amidohydrolase
VGTVRVRGHMVDDDAARLAEEHPSVAVINATGTSPFVLVCDHAANRIPAEYGNLGLTSRQRLMHIAWDPGALGVAHELSALLDAPLIHSTVCRLVIDCNRDEKAVDLIPVVSERTEISANAGISESERRKRITAYHAPFHGSIEAMLDKRKAAVAETILVTVHSFTPTYKDVWRPWEIGLIHGSDPSFTEALHDALIEDDATLNVGWNQPYSARNGVTYTLETHGDGRGLDASMIEIRHDEILEPEGVGLWATRLARCLERARGAFAPTPARTEQLGANRRPL